jgi:hypothetical protein
VSPVNQRGNIAEELAHAEEALRAADALVGLGLFRDAANRLYYAAEECRGELGAAREFIDTVRTLLSGEGWLSSRAE